jgi:hypothetical protein
MQGSVNIKITFRKILQRPIQSQYTINTLERPVDIAFFPLDMALTNQCLNECSIQEIIRMEYHAGGREPIKYHRAISCKAFCDALRLFMRL